jgi:hypothetical protein
MKTTGYALREAMKNHTLNKEVAEGDFTPSLKHTEGEDPKALPKEVFQAFLKADMALAKLEEAQVRYNLAVRLDFNGQNITLLDAIKRVGILGRVEKMWKGTIANPVAASNYFDEPENKVKAKRTLPASEALALTKMYGKQASSLRASIAAANAVVVDIEDLDASLFEDAI